ncbi:MAG: hypothetical protein DYG99_09075 [Bacteroidetes bacterium CHB5]|nr:hypothetical protein [Bacteroidetes bacterium CHB5]
MKTIEKILLSENTKAIEAANKSAKERSEKLNEIANVFEFESEKEFNQRTENLDRLVKAAMMQRPELKRLSETVQIDSIRVPNDIAEAKRKLLAIIETYDDLFLHISFDGMQWVEDIDKLEGFAESQRLYAIGESQIKKYDAAKALCEFLNSEKLGWGSYEKIPFANIMIEWSLQSNCWIPSNRWIVS